MITARPLDETWPIVEAAIIATCEKLDYPPSLPAVLHALCLSGKAYLYTFSESDAFAIVQPQVDTGTHVVVMYVWMGHNAGQSPLTVEQYEAYMNELAQGMGATEVRMQSKRKGFERTGWKIEHIVYSRPVKGA